MKLLIGAIVLQTFALVYLVIQTVETNERLETLVVTVSEGQGTEVPVELTTSAGQNFDEFQLRRVIREELAALMGQPADPAPTNARARSQPSSPAEVQAAELALEQVVNSGYIDQSQLEAMQMQFAQLDPNAREQMFRRLTRAINNGAVRITIQ
ncbi:MAG: hypothetical protein HUJ31_15915 [Pseudomonadales bacterium]|nr:hypothetical protein [Pseudomonadales bacterium]